MLATVTATPLAYSPNEAAKAIGHSRTRVYELIASGQLRAKKDGRRTVILHAELERYLAELPDRELS